MRAENAKEVGILKIYFEIKLRKEGCYITLKNPPRT